MSNISATQWQVQHAEIAHLHGPLFSMYYVLLMDKLQHPRRLTSAKAGCNGADNEKYHMHVKDIFLSSNDMNYFQLD